MTPYDSLIQSGFANLSLVDEMYEKFRADPHSVDSSWRLLFEGETPKMVTPVLKGEQEINRLMVDQLTSGGVRIAHLIEAYRTYGHYLAKVNPLATEPLEEPWQLKLETLGFSESELNNRFPTDGLLKESTATLQQIIDYLRETYCGNIGIEYMGLENPDMEHWLQNQIEPNQFKIALNFEQKRMILQHLNKSELFELFLHTKYTGQKRFSLEGGETLIPILEATIQTGSQLGIEEFVLGMAHRGRLNVLTNILEKSYVDIFSEFEEGYIPDSFEGSGDVKYHKGFNAHVKTRAGKTVRVDMPPNPSHLESVDPIVEGEVFARQLLINDETKKKIIPILVHGDAAIAGQGICYETMQLYKLPGYSTGGTLHIVINNQIGFTTLPEDSRSTHYCTDIARTFRAPVFHVNAEDPEACIYATNLAIELRQKYQCDVFIDLNCYRKFGHNETDEPAYTQPYQYSLIRQKKPIRELYRDALIQQGILEKQMAESLEKEFKEALQKALNEIKIPQKKTSPVKFSKIKEFFRDYKTAVSPKILREVTDQLCAIPPDFALHKKLENLIKERQQMGHGEKPIDWGMGETLAYGSLLWDGVSIRLAGQDVCRGTFSHRHAMLMDQKLNKPYFPLQHLKENQGRFDVINSPLSEYAGLGFEFGYSIGNPKALVIWEAQFGDFANGAQIIIDQYIAAAEEKWGQKTRIALFLPHGYEGQGPEHSSGRIERFLTLAGDSNMQVVYPSTPAQLFHLIRRQAILTEAKPLIVFTPKGLLRHPACVSTLEDLAKGAFEEILDDPRPLKKVKDLIFCSGRIYYDLDEERQKREINDMALIRIEQLYPFAQDKIKALLKKYKGFKRCVWVQEEPHNMGAWSFIHPHLNELLPDSIEIEYIGRACCASPAVGSYVLHKQQHAEIMQQLFGKKHSLEGK
ncbi:MAG: 2-oxoglutarate dehydrogenase E1 component [Parachlamydia sp.]|nr:MAG: 2-oxoglutarate dehydrogenase E1 component [Parachlamydia sp.]